MISVKEVCGLRIYNIGQFERNVKRELIDMCVNTENEIPFVVVPSVSMDFFVLRLTLCDVFRENSRYNI